VGQHSMIPDFPKVNPSNSSTGKLSRFKYLIEMLHFVLKLIIKKLNMMVKLNIWNNEKKDKMTNKKTVQAFFQITALSTLV
jgi:hypothetical protein